ncbi:MAG: ribonuclease HII [Lachnospiraceae bacterium]|nr:ribonuclease HII [Candidatus Minthocola equi]
MPKLDLEKERIRLSEMRMYEQKYSEFQYICGIDEAGRGPLAGPVVAAACILPADCEILYLNDSKKLSEKRRELLFEEIKEKAISYGIGVISEQDIDEINILQATFKAMRLAVSQLAVSPELILVDGSMRIPDMTIRQIPIVKGDARSVSIAAASILAKVTRDHLMISYADLYPDYGFERNKGYGSAEHIAAIKSLGPCEIHRRTFIKNFI